MGKYWDYYGYIIWLWLRITKIEIPELRQGISVCAALRDIAGSIYRSRGGIAGG